MSQRKKLQITPDRVRKKIQECSFFFRKMDETANDPAEECGFYLSAFLSALKSIEYLAPLADADRKRQKQIKAELDKLRKTHPSLNYLLTVRDVEVHREGVEIAMDLVTELKLTERSFNFPSARFKRVEGRARFDPRLTARFDVPPKSSLYRPIYNYTWVFRDNPREVVQTCRESLNELANKANALLGL
jgi:hypothetical protein